MRRVARGDEAAFTELVEGYGPKLLAVARRLLGSRADAEDAVQRALLQCYQSAAGYEPRWAVSTWLYRILTNICVDELRRRTVRHAYAAAPPAERRPSSTRPATPAGASTWPGRSRACPARRACSSRSTTSTGSAMPSSRASAASRSIP